MFLLARFLGQPESLQSRVLFANNLCLDYVAHAEIVILPCSLLQPRWRSRILPTSSHGSPFFWQPRADRSPLRPLGFSPPPPCPIEALLNVRSFRERRGPQPDIRALPLAPSRSRSSFLKQASAHFRALSEFMRMSPVRRSRHKTLRLCGAN